MPDSLGKKWPNRGYYGSVSHNVKAIYAFYLGWFDGVPAHLNPHPPVEAGGRYVEAIGGPDAVLAKGQAAFDAGDYRWAAELINHLVFAHPENAAARQLLADSYEQLGYQSENATWRNFYLVGAMELRGALPRPPANQDGAAAVSAVPLSDLFDYWSVRLDGNKAAEEDLALRFVFPDAGADHRIEVRRGVLRHYDDRPSGAAGVTVTLNRPVFDELYSGAVTLADAHAQGRAEVTGDPAIFTRLLELLDTFDVWFNVIEP